MYFQPYLTFDGHAAEALRFYERLFGGKVETLMTFGDMPADAAGTGCTDAAAAAPMPEAVRKRLLHGALVVDGQLLMASDTMPGQPYEGQKGVGLAMSFDTVERAREVFAALSEGGEVQMPLGETFWSEIFGACKDRFGTSWLINGGERRM